MRNHNPLIEDNVKKYGKPPTWEQIQSLINESGISSIYHFEKYYGIVFNHLAKVKCGERQLSRSYWHFFYERILPERGIGFSTPNGFTKVHKKQIPKVIPRKRVITYPADTENHDRLISVK